MKFNLGTSRVLATLSLLSVVGLANAAEKTYLNIGDPAPALVPAKWLKGTALKSFEPGKIYVVEFWATWCGPCKENIPHLTELAKKFQGKASINGISIWENQDPTVTTYIKKVEEFVKGQGDKMNYNVAVDTPDSKIGNGWMKAAGESGIPTTFIIGRDGKIAWIGHPANLEPVLTEVVNDRFNVAVAKATRDTKAEPFRSIREAAEGKDWNRVLSLIQLAEAAKPESARMFVYDKLVAQYHASPKDAIAASDAIIAQSNGEIGAYRMIASIFATYKDLTPDVYTYGKGLIAKAIEKNEMKYMFLAMSAEVNASLGDRQGAIAAQEQAVKEAQGDPHAPADFVAFLKKNLEKFKAAN